LKKLLNTCLLKFCMEKLLLYICVGIYNNVLAGRLVPISSTQFLPEFFLLFIIESFQVFPHVNHIRIFHRFIFDKRHPMPRPFASQDCVLPHRYGPLHSAQGGHRPLGPESGFFLWRRAPPGGQGGEKGPVKELAGSQSAAPFPGPRTPIHLLLMRVFCTGRWGGAAPFFQRNPSNSQEQALDFTS